MIVGSYGGDSYKTTAQMIAAFVSTAAARAQWLAALSWISRLPEVD